MQGRRGPAWPIALVALLPAAAFAADVVQSDPSTGFASTLQALRWEPAPGEPGVARAPLWGQPDGPHGEMLRVAAGTREPPSTHGALVRLAVISGALTYAPRGEAAREYGPGSYVSIPGGLPHALACRRGCVLLRVVEGRLDRRPVGGVSAVAVRADPRHVLRLENELVRVLDVALAPGEATSYHQHALDYVYVVVKGGELSSERPDGVEGQVRMVTGTVNVVAYSASPATHRMVNVGSDALHLVGIELLPTSRRFTPSSRAAVPPYELVLDQDRVRAWHLVLAPGASTPAITQSAPGLRVTVCGGVILETTDGRAAQRRDLRPGGVIWQPPGTTRALVNIGASRVELVELELR